MKRTGFIQRRTPLKVGAAPARKSRLRSGRSTGKPTKAQAERIDRLKRGECVSCWLNRQSGRPTAHFGGCDAHHVLSGGIRRGHHATLACCPWHHRGVKPYDQMTDAQATDLFGPSLAHGSKPFHALYGSDDELLALQEQLLALENHAQEAP
jgi:hypothetical protein